MGKPERRCQHKQPSCESGVHCVAMYSEIAFASPKLCSYSFPAVVKNYLSSPYKLVQIRRFFCHFHHHFPMRCTKMSLKGVEWNPSQSSVKFCTRWSILFSFRQREPSPVFSLIYVIIIHVISSWRSELQTSDLPRSPFFENSSKVFWRAVTCDVAFQGMICRAPWPAELRVDSGPRWTPTSGLGELQPRLRDTSHLFQMTGGRQCVIKSFSPLLRLPSLSSREMLGLFTSSSSRTFPNVRFSLQAAGVPQFPD